MYRLYLVAEPAPERSNQGGQAFIRGSQSLKLSTKADVYKKVSLLIGGGKHVDWGARLPLALSWRRPCLVGSIPMKIFLVNHQKILNYVTLFICATRNLKGTSISPLAFANDISLSPVLICKIIPIHHQKIPYLESLHPHSPLTVKSNDRKRTAKAKC